jgi:hypothetical protein
MRKHLEEKINYACAIEQHVPSTWDRFVRVTTNVLAFIGALALAVVLVISGGYYYAKHVYDQKIDGANAQCGSCRLGNNK